MKKALLIIVVSLFALSSVFAVSLDDIINGAKELSPTYQNVILSYENSLINIRNLERKDKVGVSVSASVNPLVVAAGLPSRIPLVTKGLLVSFGTEFLFTVMWTLSSKISISLPVGPSVPRSTSSR